RVLRKYDDLVDMLRPRGQRIYERSDHRQVRGANARTVRKMLVTYQITTRMRIRETKETARVARGPAQFSRVRITKQAHGTVGDATARRIPHISRNRTSRRLRLCFRFRPSRKSP